jgi:hypothetical protein
MGQMAATKVEKNLTLAFLKSVGAECGLYNPSTKQFKAGIESESLYQANLEIVAGALKKHWKASELEDFIWQRYNAGERKALLSEILPDKAPATKVEEHENLLCPEVTYQHAQLYIRRAPSFDIHEGVMIPITRGTVTPKESFTLRELAEYYFSQMHVGSNPRMWANVLGIMRSLLTEARADEILTAVDLACAANPTTPAIQLYDHLEAARSEVSMREARTGSV